MENALLYRMALALTPGMKSAMIDRMEMQGMDAEAFFGLETSDLIGKLEVGERSVPRMRVRQEALEHARAELQYIAAHDIRFLAYGHDGYPRRLSNCPDAPAGLFVVGEADLDSSEMMAVVGTRRCTAMGAGFVAGMVKGLSQAGVRPTVVSGLALGIDTTAHEAALFNELPTVAVVAHGLDTIYPSLNRNLARDIVRKGGAIVTEYPSRTPPYRQRFLERNRIVAGLSDLTLVVESEVKGGAMSTARFAFEYDRTVGALPGRYTDVMSAGCNHLIRTNRAALIESAADVMTNMQWHGIEVQAVTPSLFEKPEGDAKVVYELLSASAEPIHISELKRQLGCDVAQTLSLLGQMEFDGLVRKLPGNKFMLVK